MLSLAKADLEVLSKTRLDDAQALLQQKRYSACYYLSGYVIELALKAVIAKNFNKEVIPDKKFVQNIYTHDIENLIGLAQLTNELKNEIANKPIFSVCWSNVIQWDESSRYQLIDMFRANEMYASVSDPNNGVYQWVKKYW